MAHGELVSIERSILTLRGQRVILSADLAAMYNVRVKALNQAVKRNSDRFPADFAFWLTVDEAVAVQRSRSQSVTLKRGANVKYRPLAFTEHGAVMAATVLNSPRAVQMSIYVVRAFLHLREWVAGQSELAARLDELERKVGAQDRELQTILQAIRQLVQSPEGPRPRIGFSEGKA